VAYPRDNLYPSDSLFPWSPDAEFDPTEGWLGMAFKIKQGARRPVFVVVLKDDFGEPSESIVNLTTASTVVFNMRAASGGAVKVNRGGAIISNAAGGEVTYNWSTADTDTAASYEAEVEVTWNDGKRETFPNDSYWMVEITDDIA